MLLTIRLDLYRSDFKPDEVSVSGAREADVGWIADAHHGDEVYVLHLTDHIEMIGTLYHLRHVADSIHRACDKAVMRHPLQMAMDVLLEVAKTCSEQQILRANPRDDDIFSALRKQAKQARDLIEEVYLAEYDPPDPDAPTTQTFEQGAAAWNERENA